MREPGNVQSQVLNSAQDTLTHKFSSNGLASLTRQGKYSKLEEDHNGALSSLYSSFGSFQDGFPVRAGYHPGHYYLAATADDQVGPNFYLTTTESCHLHDRYPVATKY